MALIGGEEPVAGLPFLARSWRGEPGLSKSDAEEGQDVGSGGVDDALGEAICFGAKTEAGRGIPWNRSWGWGICEEGGVRGPDDSVGYLCCSIDISGAPSGTGQGCPTGGLHDGGVISIRFGFRVTEGAGLAWG